MQRSNQHMVFTPSYSAEYFKLLHKLETQREKYIQLINANSNTLTANNKTTLKLNAAFLALF